MSAEAQQLKGLKTDTAPRCIKDGKCVTHSCHAHARKTVAYNSALNCVLHHFITAFVLNSLFYAVHTHRDWLIWENITGAGCSFSAGLLFHTAGGLLDVSSCACKTVMHCAPPCSSVRVVLN